MPHGPRTTGVARVPIRTCVGCRRRAGQTALLRVVVRDGTTVLDRMPRSAGRGAYLCPTPSCVERGVARDGARLRRALRASTGVYVDVEALRTAVRGTPRREGVST